MGKQLHGGDIYSTNYRIDFSASINPMGTPKSVVEAACAGVSLSEHYPDTKIRELRSAIAAHEHVSEESVVCSNGAAELIYALVCEMWAMGGSGSAAASETGDAKSGDVKSGDTKSGEVASHAKGKRTHALVLAPGFAEYEQALELYGVPVRHYECREEDNFVPGMDLIEQITEETGMIFLCNPNNPTGLEIPKDLLEAVIDRCHETGTLLVLDECFAVLTDEPENMTMISHLERVPELFILKAFTKLYAMAGLRLGYGLCSDKERVARIRRCMQPWNVSIPAQMAGVAALKEKEFAARSLAYIASERQCLKTSLEEMGIHCYDSKANYLFFKVDVALRLGERCAEQGILLRDCSSYKGLADGYYRIAVRTHEENAELVRVFSEIMK